MMHIYKYFEYISCFYDIFVLQLRYTITDVLIKETFMSRKAIISKKQIIQAAFDIAKVHGKNSITIRAIGMHLSISTAPIYTQYKSIDAIMIDLTTFVNDQVLASTLKKITGGSFLDIGVGYLDFVIIHPLIFNDFFLTMGNSIFETNQDADIYLNQMKKNPFLCEFNKEQLDSLLYDMSVYTYGLATMICTKKDIKHELPHYRNLLEQAGNKLISYHLYSSGKYETVINTLLEKISKHIDLKEVFKS